MTRKLLRAFAHFISERRRTEFKMHAALQGVRIDDEKPWTPEEAQALLSDPLANFPDDIDYLTRQEVQNHLVHASRLRRLALPTVWDDSRAQAALGSNLTARRAAQNDVLWSRYLELHTRGVQVSLDLLKYLVAIDVARSKLYPNSIRYGEYAIAERRAGRIPKDLDLNAPPPRWYVEELHRLGELPAILKEIGDLVKRKRHA